MSRNKYQRLGKTESIRPQAQRPHRRRSAATEPQQLDGDACREAVSFLVHSPDEASVFEKMKITVHHRQDLVQDPQRTTDVLKTFPRFLDVKRLLTPDFLLLFGAETDSKMFEKWDAAFKPTVIKEAKHLTQTAELCRLLTAAENFAENNHTTPAGRKRIKISPSEAVGKMLHFHKSCCSIVEHLQGREAKQPYILAVGRTQNRTDAFYLVVDKQLLPCKATSSLGAFDELFKSHDVFNLSSDETLGPLLTFVQTTIDNIDVATTDESPRVRELRAKVLN